MDYTARLKTEEAQNNFPIVCDISNGPAQWFQDICICWNISARAFFPHEKTIFQWPKSGFWAHILHLLGIYLYWKVVLDLRFGSARTESEEKATWIFDTYGKSAHGCQILQTWSRYLVRVWCALCRTGVLGDDRMKLDNVLGLMIEDFLEQRQGPGMSFFQQRLNILPWSRSRFPYVFVTQPLINDTFSSLSLFEPKEVPHFWLRHLSKKSVQS